ncbi:DUF6266 family protein [Pedobacter africanus]|uniref:Uncharacterized protein n=1 Tax=Pedobacter africanus TaxID=151894 RepID=A0A1W2A083_9SPHI|nr:DUF6266 family protein [Pedobacter africanus]SMC54087.1 hypothetical protein SAMN04488524_1129 [Pedobacter africanus]
MARYKNGINGPVSGKIGNVVGGSWRGIDYLRSLPDTSNKTFSEKQKNQHFLMGLVSSWLKPLKLIVEKGYQAIMSGKTPMNACVSYHMKNAVEGNSPLEYMIDFAKVILSRGELLIPLIREVLSLIDAVLHIKWENASASIFNNEDDKATIVVYNPAKKAFVSFEDVAQRADKEVMLRLPAGYAGDTVHCWQHFVNANGNMVSTSVYLGELLVVGQGSAGPIFK